MPARPVAICLDDAVVRTPSGKGWTASTPKTATPKSMSKSVPAGGLLQRRRFLELKMNCAAITAEDHAPCGLPRSLGQTNPSNRLLERYEVLEELGQGTTGVVHHARQREDGKEVALKTIRTNDIEFIKIIQREYSLLRGIQHPHIIRALDLVQTETRMVLVLEFFKGSTLEKAVKGALARSLPETVAQGLFRMLLQAIDYLHQRRIVHRDVKAPNILVSGDMTDLKLVDFNTARCLIEGGSLTMTGTQGYMAPEVLLGDSPSEFSDIWSAGLCLHFMLRGRLPRQPGRYATIQDFGKAVATHPLVPSKACWKHVSDPCKNVLRSCMEVDKSLRPAAMTLLESEWLKSAPAGSQRAPSKVVKRRTLQTRRFITVTVPRRAGSKTWPTRKRAGSSPR